MNFANEWLDGWKEWIDGWRNKLPKHLLFFKFLSLVNVIFFPTNIILTIIKNLSCIIFIIILVHLGS